MKTTEFYSFYNNQPLDFDGAYGTQCVDVVQQFSVSVLGIPPWGTGNAVGRWTSYPQEHFDRIRLSEITAFRDGDIVIWDKTQGNPYGHIAVATGKEDGQRFEAFGANWPVGDVCGFDWYTRKNVLGILRFKHNFENEDSMSAQERAELEQLRADCAWMRGVVAGVASATPYATPDGSGHILITCKAEDQLKFLGNIPQDQPVPYVYVKSVDIVSLETSLHSARQEIEDYKAANKNYSDANLSLRQKLEEAKKNEEKLNQELNLINFENKQLIDELEGRKSSIVGQQTKPENAVAPVPVYDWPVDKPQVKTSAPAKNIEEIIIRFFKNLFRK